jgi:hypothetical protein
MENYTGFLKEPQIEQLYDLAMWLLEIYTKDLKSGW